MLCTKRAAISPIPATIFDDLLDLVIENLYYNVFPRYMLKVGIEFPYQYDAQPPLTPIDEISNEEDYFDEQESIDCNSYEFKIDVPNQLLHRTSQVFDYMCSTASSVYSDIEYSDDGDEQDFSGDFDSNFYSLMNSHGTKYSQQTITEEIYFNFDDNSASKISSDKTLSTLTSDPKDLEAINMIFDTYNPPSDLPKRKNSLDPNLNKHLLQKTQIGVQKSQKDHSGWKTLIRNSMRGTFMR